MPSLAEHLTERFYDWEMLGRGWQVYDSPLVPEPPFRPFFGHFADGFCDGATDDGRQHTLVSRFIQWLRSPFRSRPRPQAAEAEADAEPELRVDRRTDFVRLGIVVPAGVTYPKDVTAQFLLNLSQCQHLTCLEFLGLPGQITTSLVVDESDAAMATTQLQNHFPDASIATVEDELVEAWEPDAELMCVELGLADECMLPIQTYRSFNPDPLTGLIATLGTLEAGEFGLVQVYFAATANPWAASIRRAVTSPSGREFFANAPGFSKQAATKLASPLYGAVIRLCAQSSRPGREREIVRSLARGLAVADNPDGNRLVPLVNDAYESDDQLSCMIGRATLRTGMLLSLDELLTVVHLPGASVASPALVRSVAKTKAAPAVCRSGSVRLGDNTHLGEIVPVFQPAAYRPRHTYVLGASGTGKSTLLASMIDQDIRAGRGVGVLDPHGDLVSDVLARIPEERVDDVVLLDLSDEAYPVPMNVLSAHSELERNLLASDLAAGFKRLTTSWGDQMTAVLSNGILAILESTRGGTLADLRRFLVEKRFREEYLASVTDDEVVYYWQHEFGLATGKPQGSVVTRLNTFLRPKPIRYMVAHGENRLDVSRMMDEGAIFLARIPQGAIGEENAYLLGTILVSAFHRAALCRQEQAVAERSPFFLYIDEFHDFITPSMAQILSGARKYGLALVLAHQELRQLESRDPEVASAVLTNPATQVLFRLGDHDAKRMEGRLASFTAADLQNLEVGQAVARVERADWDFNLAIPLPPEVPQETHRSRVEAIRERSRARFAVSREEVEQRIAASRPKRDARREESAKESAEQPAAPPEPLKTAPAPEPVEPSKPRDKREKETPTLTATPPAAVMVTPPEPSQGRGGLKHKAIQRLIAHWGEGMGFRAEREKPILDGRGAVDVLLTKGELAIACEISVTTPTAHEYRNLTKCLEAGFGHVVMVSDDEEHLRRIEAKAKDHLEAPSLEQMKFMQPKRLFGFIEEMEEAATEGASEVRGYRVSVNRADLDAASREARMSSVKRTIARSAMRAGRTDLR